MHSSITGLVLALSVLLATTATPLPPQGGPKLDLLLFKASDLDPILDPNEIFPSPIPAVKEHWASNTDPILDPNEIFPSPIIKKNWKRDFCDTDYFSDLCKTWCMWQKVAGAKEDCFPTEPTTHVIIDNCGGTGQPKCE